MQEEVRDSSHARLACLPLAVSAGCSDQDLGKSPAQFCYCTDAVQVSAVNCLQPRDPVLQLVVICPWPLEFQNDLCLSGPCRAHSSSVTPLSCVLHSAGLLVQPGVVLFV